MTALRRAARFEHRLTRPNATLRDLDAAAALAVEHGLAGLLVSPWLVKRAGRLLARSGVRVGTVIGFPHGGQVTAVKAFEASKALEHGAVELDFVLNAGALVSGDDDAVVADMLAVVEMAHSAMALAGVILDGTMLDDELMRRACRLAALAGADHLVTSNGDEAAPATIERTAHLHRVVGGQLEVKAAGILMDAADLSQAVAAGAARVCTEFTRHLVRDAADILSLARERAPATLADVGAPAG